MKLNELINTITNIDDLYSIGKSSELMNTIIDEFYNYISNIAKNYNIDDIDNDITIDKLPIQYQWLMEKINQYYENIINGD